MYFSNSFLLINLFLPIYITNGHFGEFDISLNLFTPMLLYSAASSSVKFIFSQIGTLFFIFKSLPSTFSLITDIFLPTVAIEHLMYEEISS